MCTGSARMPYGAMIATNANWYATTPPSTRLPITIAAASRMPMPPCWSTAHVESFRSRRSSASMRPMRGRRRNPVRASAMVGTADEAERRRASRPSRARTARCRRGARLGFGPVRIRKITSEPTTATVFAIGAIANATKRRLAKSTAVDTVPTA